LAEAEVEGEGIVLGIDDNPISAFLEYMTTLYLHP
jgi:hypothetical protein